LLASLPATESVFGFIAVLPGAFSAYRWDAIQGEPLQAYFYTEQISAAETGPFIANMYLAEDRAMCVELLCKPFDAWTLHYVAGAIAETDAPALLVDLLKQVRGSSVVLHKSQQLLSY
jgi:chitin synthase